MKQYFYILKKYDKVQLRINKNTIYIDVSLQPTESSQVYLVRIVSNKWSPIVKVFVVNPNISREIKKNGVTIPHTYNDGSLCLYYPKNKEWRFEDFWADTLIPWTCLWLYFYEIWLITDEWLGGGVHDSQSSK